MTDRINTTDVRTKHTRVNNEIILDEKHELHEGDVLVLIGHGWSNPAPHVYTHPFEIYRDGNPTDTYVEIEHGIYSELIKQGKFTPLP